MSHFCRFARRAYSIKCGTVHPLLPNRLLSLEEYLAFEESAPWKHEFVGGHVYVMAAVTARHAVIIQEGAVHIPWPEALLTLDEIYEGLPALTVREMEAIGYAVS